MRKVFIFLLLLLLSDALFSQQNQYDSLQYKMIKATVDFYATDTRLYKDNTFKKQDIPFTDKTSIIAYSKNLQGVSVEPWYQQPINSCDELATLHDQIIGTVFIAKRNRDSLPQSKAFRTTMNSLLKACSDPGSTSGAQTLAKGDSPATQKSNAEPLSNNNVTKEPVHESSSLLPLIALVVAVISLVSVIIVASWLMSKISEGNKRITKRKDEIDELRNKLTGETYNMPASASKTTKPLEEKIKMLEDRIIVLERRLKPGNSEEPPKMNLPKETAGFTPKKKITAEQPADKMMYAKMPDVNNGSGFSDAMLSATQNGEQIYEITIKGNVATFIITNDAKAQKYALSDYMRYLAEACEFMNQPSPNCRIDTKIYGTLARRGNDWLINEKARIEFV